jgi:hypothetical protein
MGFPITGSCAYRIVPISEAKSVAEWVAAQHDDEGEDDETWSRY